MESIEILLFIIFAFLTVIWLFFITFSREYCIILRKHWVTLRKSRIIFDILKIVGVFKPVLIIFKCLNIQIMIIWTLLSHRYF